MDGHLVGFGVWALVVFGDDESFQDRVELLKTERRVRERFSVRSVRDIPR